MVYFWMSGRHAWDGMGYNPGSRQGICGSHILCTVPLDAETVLTKWLQVLAKHINRNDFCSLYLTLQVTWGAIYGCFPKQVLSTTLITKHSLTENESEVQHWSPSTRSLKTRSKNRWNTPVFAQDVITVIVEGQVRLKVRCFSLWGSYL